MSPATSGPPADAPLVDDDPAVLIERARRVLARGVTSSARERARPIILTEALGGLVRSADGRWLIDLVNALGPVILGHADPRVATAVRRQLDRGVLFGNHPGEIELAEALAERLPWAETTCLASSGSEAVHLALRIARTTTGRRLVVKFEGQYHGWIDPMYVSLQGAPAQPLEEDGQVPATPGVPGSSPDVNVVVLRWNDLDALARCFANRGGDIAAVILDPVAVGVGMPEVDETFLSSLQSLCAASGAILLFDEVLTGFRLGPRGAAGLLGIEPDMAVYAKALANGFPIAAVTGRRSAMAAIGDGPLRPAGTYNGSPISVAAANATLGLLDAACYRHLDALGARLQRGLEDLAVARSVPLTVHRWGSIVQLHWSADQPVRDHVGVTSSRLAAIADLCEGALDGGVLAAPRGLLILNAAQTVDQMDHAVAAFGASLDAMAS